MKTNIICFAFLIIFFSSCGTTQLFVNHGGVYIYVNNVNKGKDMVRITRAGPPKTQTVTAKYHGQTVGEIKIRRKFDIVTALVGIETYGLGFFLCWRYPSMIVIPVNISDIPYNKSESIWMKPPKFWK
jgi:hypothetical protein